MKYAIKSSFFTLLIFAKIAQIFASNDSLVYQKQPVIPILTPRDETLPIITKLVKQHENVASFYALTGSNSVPLELASRLVTGGYISPSEMKNYESMLDKENRIGFVQDISVSLYPLLGVTQHSQGNPIFKNITLGTQSLGGITFTKDAFGVFFRGNTPYLGERKEIGNNQFYQLRQRYLNIQFNKNIRWGKLTLSPELTFSQVLDFSRGATKDLFLQTDKNADSVIFGGRFYNQSTGYHFWGQGFGFAAGFQASMPLGNRNLLIFGVHDLGILNVSKINNQARGYELNSGSLDPGMEIPVQDVNIQSVEINGTAFKSNQWFGRQVDTVIAKIGLEEKQSYGTILSPFRVDIVLNSTGIYTANSRWRGYRFALNYIHMVGFIPRWSGEFRWAPHPKFVLAHGVSYGGFDRFDLNTSLNFSAGTIIGNTLQWSVYLRGIESLIAPDQYSGGGIGINLSYPFNR